MEQFFVMSAWHVKQAFNGVCGLFFSRMYCGTVLNGQKISLRVK